MDFRFNRSRYRRKSPEDSRRGAEAFEVVLKKRLLNGEDISEDYRKPERNFDEFAEYWFKTYACTNNKESTLRSKRMILDRHLIPFLKDTPLNSIDTKVIELLKAKKLKEDLAVKTVNNIISVLRTCLQMAHEWGELEMIPKFRWLKVSEQPFDFLNEEECSRLILYAPDQVIKNMIHCAVKTGMRRGEMLGLDWSAVDFNQRTISVRQSLVEGRLDSTKNNRIRHIPMTQDLLALLRSHRKGKGFVFSRDGKPLTGIGSNKELYKACRDSGIRRIGWHVLRHTFASHLVMRGVPIRAVQALMGHSSIQMTERYSHLTPSTLVDAISVLEGGNESFGHYVGIRNNDSQSRALKMDD